MRLLALVALLALSALAFAEEPKARYETRAVHDPDGIGKFYKGREIAHVMGFQAAGWLDRSEREKEEEPAKLLKALDLKPGLTVADVGSGTGFHAFRIAPLVGPAGKVLAVDVQPEMVALIEARAKKEKVENVVAVKCTEADPKLPAGEVDLILLVDVYHELEFPHEVATKMVAALKPGGRIAFVEFRREDAAVPIKLVHKMSERQVILEMAEFPELEHTKTIGGLPWQHIVVFTKAAKK